MNKRYGLLIVLLLKVSFGQSVIQAIGLEAGKENPLKFNGLALRSGEQPNALGYCLVAIDASPAGHDRYYLIKDWEKILPSNEAQTIEPQVQEKSLASLLAQLNDSKGKNKSRCK